jgi:hypothetical protein
MVNRVETIKRSHQQSGHLSSGSERLEVILSSFFSPKGKNVDIPFFYVFLMLDDKDPNFVSLRLGNGIGASTGFGTIGGGNSIFDSKQESSLMSVLTSCR